MQGPIFTEHYFANEKEKKNLPQKTLLLDNFATVEFFSDRFDGHDIFVLYKSIFSSDFIVQFQAKNLKNVSVLSNQVELYQSTIKNSLEGSQRGSSVYNP